MMSVKNGFNTQSMLVKEHISTPNHTQTRIVARTSIERSFEFIPAVAERNKYADRDESHVENDVNSD